MYYIFIYLFTYLFDIQKGCFTFIRKQDFFQKMKRWDKKRKKNDKNWLKI